MPVDRELAKRIFRLGLPWPGQLDNAFFLVFSAGICDKREGEEKLG